MVTDDGNRAVRAEGLREGRSLDAVCGLHVSIEGEAPFLVGCLVQHKVGGVVRRALEGGVEGTGDDQPADGSGGDRDGDGLARFPHRRVDCTSDAAWPLPRLPTRVPGVWGGLPPPAATRSSAHDPPAQSATNKHVQAATWGLTDATHQLKLGTSARVAHGHPDACGSCELPLAFELEGCVWAGGGGEPEGGGGGRGREELRVEDLPSMGGAGMGGRRGEGALAHVLKAGWDAMQLSCRLGGGGADRSHFDLRYCCGCKLDVN